MVASFTVCLALGFGHGRRAEAAFQSSPRLGSNRVLLLFGDRALQPPQDRIRAGAPASNLQLPRGGRWHNRLRGMPGADWLRIQAQIAGRRRSHAMGNPRAWSRQSRALAFQPDPPGGLAACFHMMEFNFAGETRWAQRPAGVDCAMADLRCWAANWIAQPTSPARATAHCSRSARGGADHDRPSRCCTCREGGWNVSTNMDDRRAASRSSFRLDGRPADVLGGAIDITAGSLAQ